MTDSASKTQTEQAQPPAAGRQDHESMRAASMTPVNGPAGTNALAASGGMNVPGGDVGRPAPIPAAAVHEPIPGERDATTLTHRQVGAMGSYAGEGVPSLDPQASVDEKTAHDRALEGGGEDRER